MTVEEINKLVDKKIAENPNKIVIKYFELKVEQNLSSSEMLSVLNLIRNRLNNLGYKIFSTGNEYSYRGKKYVVKINELLVAVKD